MAKQTVMNARAANGTDATPVVWGGGLGSIDIFGTWDGGEYIKVTANGRPLSHELTRVGAETFLTFFAGADVSIDAELFSAGATTSLTVDLYSA